jgi:hypothetical protein
MSCSGAGRLIAEVVTMGVQAELLVGGAAVQWGYLTAFVSLFFPVSVSFFPF